MNSRIDFLLAFASLFFALLSYLTDAGVIFFNIALAFVFAASGFHRRSKERAASAKADLNK